MTEPNHIAEARKKVGRPQIREIFLRNGARIEPGRDDLPDWVYESAFDLLEMAAPCASDQCKTERQASLAAQNESQTAPAVRGEPVAAGGEHG